MKKIIYPLALFFALAAYGNINAQQNQTKTATVIQNDDNVTVRQNINRSITNFVVEGKSAVKLVYDTTNYIIVNFDRQETNPLEEKWVVVKGMTLLIDDPEGYAVYEVHLKKSELQVIKNSMDNPILYSSAPYIFDESDEPATYSETSGNLAARQQLDEARHQLNEARRQLAEAKKNLSQTLLKSHGERIGTYTFINDSVSDDSSDELIPLEPIDDIDNHADVVEMVIDSGYTKPNYHYDWEDRSGAAFLWGFNNWGSNWYNGLSKMDGAYELRTSFSSWQLELTYAVIMTRHFYLDLGVGYESDIYKFTQPLIDIDQNGFLQDRFATILNSNYNSYTTNNQEFANTHLEDWSSRIVTRYISLPIDFVFRFNNEFKIGFAAIPALAFSSSHTGLKHEMDTKELEYQDVENISKYITPYKLDLRFTLRYEHFGIFAQVATTSLFTDKDVFPFKIGFIIK